jgi:hypothetical protein
MQDARDVAQYVRTRVDYPVVTNSLGAGRSYFTDHTEQLVPGSDVSDRWSACADRKLDGGGRLRTLSRPSPGGKVRG